MRYLFRLFLVPLLFTAAHAGPSGTQPGEFHGKSAQNFIAALVNSSDALQHYVFRNKEKKIRFSITDLDIRGTDRLDAYAPEDGLYALPCATAEGKLKRITPAHPRMKFHGAMTLYNTIRALDITPERDKQRNIYRFRQISCLIDRAKTDIEARFTCIYVKKN